MKLFSTRKSVRITINEISNVTQIRLPGLSVLRIKELSVFTRLDISLIARKGERIREPVYYAYNIHT